MRTLLVVMLAACGDNKQRPDAGVIAHVDAAVDATPDAPNSSDCRGASDCVNTANPVCCLTEHAGGELIYGCATGCAQYVACKEGFGCLTISGTAGTCVEMMFGPLQTPAWVCQ